MTAALAEALRRVERGAVLPAELAQRAFGDLMDGRATPIQAKELLSGLASRGESAEEVAGAVVAMRERMHRVATWRAPLLDTCGIGGMGRDLFNVSTAAAIVAAGAGAAVAKHGNRSISSRVGSADVLAAAGIDVDLDPGRAGRILDETGIVFLFAPSFHPAMKGLAAVRRELGVRTIFNLLGPLANPAGALRQIVGVGRPELTRLLADALAAVGCEGAVVFRSENGLDELTPGAGAAGFEVEGREVRPWSLAGGALPRGPVAVEELRGSDAAGNAAMLTRLLEGEAGPRREAVILNAALALTVEGRAKDVREGCDLARTALDSGAARRSFEGLRTAARAA